MIVDLIRHFKVDYDFSAWVSSDFLPSMEKEYDHPNRLVISQNPPRVDTPDRLISSDLNRAVTTARKLFNIEPSQDPRLREFPLSRVSRFPGKLPLWVWTLSNRLRSPRDIKNRFSLDILQCLQENLVVNHLTIVSHGFVMMDLQKHLRSLGFKGKGFRHPENAVVYRYQKTPS